MGLKLFKKDENKRLEKIRINYLNKQKVDNIQGYSIIKESSNLKKQEFIMKLADQYDRYGYMPEKLGEELDALFSDDNYVIGIHRTGYTSITNDVLNDIFNKGLINNGHVFSGANTGQCDIEKTVTLFNDFTILCGQLKASHGYKDSEGCVIVRIPKQCLYDIGKEPMPMYYKDNRIIKLLPQYVYGYVPIDKQGRLGNIYHNSNYSTGVIKNENLLYDDKVTYRYKKNDMELKTNQTSDMDKFNIIQDAYIETFKKHGKMQANAALINLINNNEIKYFSGELNRKKLERFVIYSDVLGILSFSLIDKLSQNSINLDSIIKLFEESCTNVEKNRKIL